MLENGTHATIAEIAAAEKINESYTAQLSDPSICGDRQLFANVIPQMLRGRCVELSGGCYDAPLDGSARQEPPRQLGQKFRRVAPQRMAGI